MRLFIAEKPQLAQIIADALGQPKRKSGYIECGQDIVTWCVGHLLELAPPEAHNSSYEKWVAADLPLKLRPHKYVAKSNTKDQLKIVGELIKKASEIVHAGDPDDEGQLLVDEVLEFFSNKNPVKRVLINDLNVNAARKALDNLRDNQEFYGLSQKALARSIGDQLYGFNMTRAYTLAGRDKGVKSVLSVGRVQTPILGLIVNRYQAFKNHAAAHYFNVVAQMGFTKGKIPARLILPEDAPVDDKNRIISEDWAKKILNDCQGKSANVTNIKTEPKQTMAPLPFSLLDLQVQMSKQYGIDAEKTLKLTQSLREEHKAITYNRSDCNYLSNEQYAEAPETLAALSRSLPELSATFKETDAGRKSRAFDDTKVSAHTAIIPTSENVNVLKMSADEKMVYMEIVKQYLVQFLPEKTYLATEAVFNVEGKGFIARSTKTTLAGWTALISANQDSDDEDTQEELSAFDAISSLSIGDTGQCDSIEIKKEKTKPLPIYTEASLLKDLQRVAKYVQDPRIKKLLLARDEGKTGEHGGIGTPATRAAMLSTLQKRGFYTVEKKKLIPTPLALEFMAALPAIATTPDMTALWHEQQQMIQAGELTVDQFLNELELFIADQVKNVDLGGLQVQQQQTTSLPKVGACCPMCKGEIATTSKMIACKKCEFRLWLQIAGKTLSIPQIETLLNKGQTTILKGFKSKAGKAFSAALVLNAEGKVEFSFK